ncbi:hypothetical protein CDAR_574321 [Caerostris darwini]|uniref:Uncharacterized protein n=1 Tax=Caerostris darwini TaxID=1538125 RepID=A0AAV4S037_9ARAC|nr:hypothetical protein CDAR_574321 [Caerostris darwini]
MHMNSIDSNKEHKWLKQNNSFTPALVATRIIPTSRTPTTPEDSPENEDVQNYNLNCLARNLGVGSANPAFPG